MTFKKTSIDLAQTNQFSKLIIDYVNGDQYIKPFYTYRPNIQAFRQAIDENNYQSLNRTLLVEVLKKQYANINPKQEKLNQIESLLKPTTFTVCTGHQLCLFTGPLYFIYKIITTINLAEQLKKQYPANDFIPIYWMASEDHDFEEISSVNLFGKKIAWENTEAKGAVGRLSTQSLAPMLSEMKTLLGTSENATQLILLFENAYLHHNTIADATRYLVHQLFEDYNLIVLDADDSLLKNEFVSIVKDDITNATNFDLVNASIKELNKIGVKPQVNPREINVFKLSKNERIRIEKASEEVLNLSPEMYSPNVVLRPLYQQMILPNLAYVGGPGELAYWLEYKAMFEHHKINFPVLIPRNFALLLDEKAESLLVKMGFTIADVFRNTDDLIKEFVTKNADANTQLNEEAEELKKVFAIISEKVLAIEKTLQATVDAELQKALNALKAIESKLLKAEKQKLETQLNQLTKLKEKYFPDGSLQERYDNFAPYYLKYGKSFIADLKSEFNPFEYEMNVFVQ